MVGYQNLNSNRKRSDTQDTGENYLADPELRYGPIEKRKCTDFLCYVIFMATIATYIFTVYYAYQNGQPD